MIELRGRIRPPRLPGASVLAAAFVAGMLCAARVHADDSPEAIVKRAQWLEQRGQGEQAQELLRRVAQRQPDNELYALARAEAYLAEKNPFWALKLLGEFIAQRPPACASRAFAARIHIQEANLEQAERVLFTAACAHSDESKLRFLLLRTEIAELRGDRSKARKYVLLGEATSARFAEDDSRLARLATRYAPDHQPTLAWNLSLGTGWASTGLGTVPLDLAVPDRQSGSALVGVDLDARLVAATWPTWRAVAEAELHLAQYLEAPTRNLSTRQPIIRLGAVLGRGPRKFFAAYAVDWVNLEGGAQYAYGAFAYSTAHRIEYRVELDHSTLAYGAFGRRQFWQADRTRLESEQGMSKVFAVSDALRLTIGGAWRVYKAENSAYDQVGATLHTALGISIPKGFELRETLALSRDVFPRSERYFDAPARQERRDTLVRVGLGLSAPETLGVKLGFSYAYTNRNSSANQYDFADHRAMLSVTWQSDSDRLRVSRIAKPGRVPMPYPDDATKVGPNTQAEVIEVIRQDETQRRNSSCLK